MTLDRRNVLFNLAPVVLVGLLAPSTLNDVTKSEVAQNPKSGTNCNSCESNNKDLQDVEDIELAFEKFGQLTDAEVAQIAKTQKKIRDMGMAVPAGLPLPGPAAIVSCALTAIWVFRKGISKNQVTMQVTEVIVGCVGIPATSWVLIRVARLVWKYRKKIAAALAAAGLTASQLAPLRNAPYPG